MAKLGLLSNKRAMIDQANTRVVVMTSVAAFILVFCAISTKTLASQAGYQNKVISAKRAVLTQLKSNVTAVASLKTAYTAFNNTAQNSIGGLTSGTGPQDGNNAKIILDALPSTYDFPALTTSLEKLLNQQTVAINGITGTDDEVAQSLNTVSATPQAVTMPFSVSVTGDYPNIQKLVNTFESSIRPIQVLSLDISGDQASLSVNISAQTFYQPAKTLNIGSKIVPQKGSVK